jgi:DNA-directed RNA polymerase subunit beta'
MSSSIRQSKKMVEAEIPEVWDILDEVIKEHPILLNRAPTLHRLSVQAFEPILIEGKAIQMHPLVCKGFNADFDGDQMAVHVPLSIEAQIEARVLMMSTNNILHPKDGKPTIVPEEDMMFGLYYLTLNSDKLKDNPFIISDFNEMEYALFTKKITSHDWIWYRFDLRDEDNNIIIKKEKTTPGRVRLFNIVPDICKKEEILSMINKVMLKNDVKNLIDYIYRNSTQTDTCSFADRIMEVSFNEATISGLSVGKDDMVIPQTKKEKIGDARKEVNKIQEQYLNGLITNGERYNKIIDIWSRCSDELASDMLIKLSSEKEPDKRNSIYMMMESGARGSKSQLQQLCAMRGLMTKASGGIIETPILSNFKEGLSLTEYFISANLSRKGYVDIALKTANAGYLTRRLVDVAQDVVVTEQDCGTHEGIILEEKIENGKVITPLHARALGRTLSKDVLDLDTNGILIKADTLIDEKMAKLIKDKEIKQIEVRSALTCACKEGICAKCYGRDLTTGILVSEGEAVGVVAAQAIGEPGTQLTMNTKHTASAGGIASESSINAPSDGNILLKNYKILKNRDDKNVVLSRNYQLNILNDSKNVLATFNIPYGSTVHHETGDKVKKGDLIAEWDPYNIPIISTSSGKVSYKDLESELSIKEKIDEDTNASIKFVIAEWKKRAHKQKKLKPAIVVDNIEYDLPLGAVLNVNNNDEVVEGDILAKVPRESSRNRDITGGLPRVVKLFEVTKMKEQNDSIMADIDGVISINDEKVKQKVTITPDDDKIASVTYLIPKNKYLFVNNGDKVHKGDILVDGLPVPHNILRILGISAFARYMVTEIQRVYEMQGIDIADKHIEIILSKMLKKVEIVDAGETSLFVGDTLYKDELDEENRRAIAEGLKPAKESPFLLGLKRASLQTKSFISAASFQETTKVLTEASVQGKVDKLKGLKENIILGRLIPAGTGLLVNKIRKGKLEAESKGAK